jgi:hypothetical protein
MGHTKLPEFHLHLNCFPVGTADEEKLTPVTLENCNEMLVLYVIDETIRPGPT